MSLTEFDQEEYDRNRRREGWEEGREEGISIGKEQGREEKALSTARNMLARNYPVNEIAEIIGLSLAEVEQLAAGQG